MQTGNVIFLGFGIAASGGAPLAALPIATAAAISLAAGLAHLRHRPLPA